MDTKTTANAGGTTLQVFDVPTRTTGKSQQTVYFIKDNLLVGIDDRAEAEAMLKRFGGNATDNLKSVKAYQATMEKLRARSRQASSRKLRWFIEPFGFIFAERTLAAINQSKRDKTRPRYYSKTASMPSKAPVVTLIS